MADDNRASILRVSVDINVWIPYFDAIKYDSGPGAVAELVHMIRDMRAGTMDLQLVMSTEMLGTLERILEEKNHSHGAISEFRMSLEDLMRTGPEGWEPHFLPTGRDQLGMHDREDAGVLASAILVRADLLITDNLKDFDTNDGESIDTKSVTYPSGASRQLRSIIHERVDGVSLVIAHPYDVLDWFRADIRPSPEMIRRRYGPSPGFIR